MRMSRSKAGRLIRLAPVAALLGLVLAGCAEETPTDVGDTLLPPDAVRTFELILDPIDVFDSDTTFTGFDRTRDAQFFVVAHEFEGVFEAHTLGLFDVPTSIGTNDSLGVLVTDTMPAIIGGRLVIGLDTLRSNAELPVTIRLYRIEEDWDPGSADWTNRIDSAGVTLPWMQPGGLGGAWVDSVVWSSENVDSAGVPVDSLVIRVDSLTMALWSDTTTRARGALITMETSGARVRVSDILLRVDARPSVKPDTVVTTTIRPALPRLIYNPPVPAPGQLVQAGGVPEWRTYFRWRDGIDTLSLPCPQISPSCTFRLGEVKISYAGLVLQPTEAPAGFVLQDSLRLATAPLLTSALAPLERSPLGNAVGTSRDFLSPSRFRGEPGGTAEVAVTPFLNQLLADTTSDGSPVSPWMALLPLVTGFDLGVATFEPGPRLRLIITVARELQLR